MQEKKSQNVNFILDRIKSKLGLDTDLALAKFLEVKPNTISSWRSRNTLDYELIIAKCDKLDFNWLFSQNANIEYEEYKSSFLVADNQEQYHNKGAPPGCESCKEKDKQLLSKQTTIEALQRASLTQSKYIEGLEEKIEELTEGGEKKRKAS